MPYYENAARLSPNNPVVHANLACNYAMLGRYDEAFKSFEAAKKNDETNETELSPGNRYYLATKLTEFERAINSSNGDDNKARLKETLVNSKS